MLKKILKLGRQELWIRQRESLRQQHQLKYLFWECTLNCNFRCKHCGSRAGENYFADEISTEKIKQTLSDIASHFNAKKIIIAVTGGEPLLRKDLFEVMEFAHRLGFRWGMVTNAYLVTPEVIAKAKAAGMETIDISIDGIGEVHDHFRNMQGSYAKSINAVKSFAAAGFLQTLRITTTVHHNNIAQLEDMYKEFSQLGATDWRLLSVDPIGRTIVNNAILLNINELTGLLDFIRSKRKSRTKPLVSYGCAHYLGDEFEGEVRDGFFYCATGINIGSILHNGDIFVCPNVPRLESLIQGNIKDDSFAEIWEKRFQIFREKNRTAADNCKDCLYWDKCLGGAFHAWDFNKNQPKLCYMSNGLYL